MSDFIEIIQGFEKRITALETKAFAHQTIIGTLHEGIGNLQDTFKVIRGELKGLDESLTKFTEVEKNTIETLQLLLEMIENND